MSKAGQKITFEGCSSGDSTSSLATTVLMMPRRKRQAARMAVTKKSAS